LPRPSTRRAGTFEVAWRCFLARRTEPTFDEYLYNRTFRGWKEAMWAAGLKLLTQVAEGKAVCFLTSDLRRRHARACLRTRRQASVKFVGPRPHADPKVARFTRAVAAL
jgi:hypothetical protein